MKTNARFALLLVVAFAVAGCAAVPVVPSVKVPPPDAGPVVSGQATKDAAVVDWSQKIDAAVDKWLALQPSELGGYIKQATAAQRAAIAANPAVDVAKLAAAYEASLKSYKEGAASDAKTIGALQKANAALQAKETTTQQWICRGIGFFCILAGVVAGYLGGMAGAPKAALFGLAGLGFLGLAQILGAWWFLPALGIACLLVVIAVTLWIVKHRQDANFNAEVQAKADLAQATLGKLVPAIDATYESIIEGGDKAGKEILERIFAAAKMEPREKAQVHQVRADLKTAQAAA